jgi:16S rRNA (cytosine967-C5)-methyltransferase
MADRLSCGPKLRHEARMDPTRSLALSLLRAVLEQHRPLEEALDRLPASEARDRAAAHRLAAAVLRRTGTLDAVLEPHLKRAPPEPVRLILRLGAAGLLFLDTPPHAAVGTAVDLARAQKLAPFAGLVNAVLRRVAETGHAVLAELDSPRLDTPAWMWAAWGAEARAIAAAHQAEAALDLTLAPGAAIPDGGVRLPNGSVRLPPGTRVADIAGFEAGQFWVQDAAAAMPARLLDARPGERVADLCAAPGGKTAQLAATGAEVIAVERDERRIPRLRENLARLALPATIVRADAAAWRPEALFDAILLDAPCSATGTIRRHPDVLHLKRERDIAPLTEGQDRLIHAAAAMLRPGGRLIYAVCSLQTEEGQARVRTAANAGLRPAPFSPDELASMADARTPDGWLRCHPALWPYYGGMDGFFCARFLK